MTLEEIQSEVDKIRNASNLTVELFFLFNESDEISIKRARLSDDVQQPLLREIMLPYIDREISSAEEVVAYDPSITPDRKTLYSIDKQEIEQYQVSTRNIETTDNFTRADNFNEIWGYMVKASSGNDEIILVRRKFPTHTLLKGFTLWNRDGQFTKFDSNVFTLDGKADAVLINNEFVIFQRTNFERVFLHDVKIELQATRTASELIETYNILEIDTEQIKEYLDQPTISKLRKIDLSLFEDGTFNYDNLDQICTEFSIDIIRDESSKKFKPGDKRQFKSFVKILSDDYLTSTLTQKKYDAHSKNSLAII